MPISIMVVALLLLTSGLGGFLLGLSLAPTDMGRAWLDVGATLLTGGMITLALGYATRAVVEGLGRLALRATPVPEAPGRKHVSQKHVFQEHSVQEHSVQEHSLQEPSVQVHSVQEHALHAGASPPRAAAAPGLAPAFAATLGAPGGRDGTSREEMGREEMGQEERGREDSERDLFAPRHQAAAPDDGRGEAAAALAAAGAAVAPAAFPAGLIADEDLAALAAQEPALAPLHRLEIVGAYDSGGMRFTMYSDGSVHALAPHGERRYPSLEALRQQLDSGQPAV